MIAFSIMMTKAPDFPDLEYTERFPRAFGEAISDNLIDIWVFSMTGTAILTRLVS